ncbi:hypothetical protein [Streptomyces orinoci]|uniref:DNA-binding protein n=1 Tax=Streptomyces orinoci TaxID=67339 RepID=A0ABV3K279_STRON|nr:hypothetical protein [Streptomyces orinoci]
MSLDAMDWVWTRSAAKGTPRLVLLAIADKCPDDRCVAYAGTTMLVQRTNAARSSVVTAVDKLIASGELEIVEGARGPRGETVYRLPHAVGHRRAAESEDARFGGPKSGGVRNPDRSENKTPGGPDSVPHRSENETPTGPESGPQNARERKHQEEQQPHASRGRSPVVEQLRPLADALDAAGVEVRWTLGLGEQRDAYRLVQTHGVAALVELAARRITPGDPPKSARYWLKVWADLDHTPARPAPGSTGSNVVPFRAPTAAPTSHTNTLAAGLALLEQEGLA